MLRDLHRHRAVLGGEYVRRRIVRAAAQRTRLHGGRAVHDRQLHRRLLLRFGLRDELPGVRRAGEPRYLHDRWRGHAARHPLVHQPGDVAVRRQVRRHDRGLQLRAGHDGVRSDVLVEPVGQELLRWQRCLRAGGAGDVRRRLRVPDGRQRLLDDVQQQWRLLSDIDVRLRDGPDVRELLRHRYRQL